MGPSLCPEQGHEGHIHEVLQEDRCSSMYSNYYAFSSCIFMYSRIVLLFLHLGNLIRNIDWCSFSQVKNKPWHTWVCTWIWHHRKQYVYIHTCYTYEDFIGRMYVNINEKKRFGGSLDADTQIIIKKCKFCVKWQVNTSEMCKISIRLRILLKLKVKHQVVLYICYLCRYFWKEEDYRQVVC